jgi:pentatricopeptide repeat protein
VLIGSYTALHTAFHVHYSAVFYCVVLPLTMATLHVLSLWHMANYWLAVVTIGCVALQFVAFCSHQLYLTVGCFRQLLQVLALPAVRGLRSSDSSSSSDGDAATALYNAAMAACIECGKTDKTLALFKDMQSKSISPDTVTYRYTCMHY